MEGPSTRPLRSSIRTRLVLLLIALSAVTVLAITFLAVNAVQGQARSAQTISGQALRTQAESYLVQLTQRGARENDLVLGRILLDAETLASYTASIYENAEALDPGSYWPYEEHMALGPEGQFANSEADLTSVFVPAQRPLTPETRRDIEITAYLDPIFQAIYEKDPNTVAVYFSSTRDVVRYYPNVNLGAVLPPDFAASQRPWFTIVTPSADPEGEPRWAPVYVDATGRGLVTTAAAPVYDGRGNLIGVVGIDVTLDNVVAGVEATKILEGGYAFLMDDQGLAIALPPRGYQDILGRSPEPDEFGTNLSETTTAFAPILERMRAGESGFESINLEGEELFVAFAPLSSTGWSVGSVVSAEEVLQGVSELENAMAQGTRSLVLFRIIPITALLLVTVIGLGLLFTNRFVAPLQDLTQAAEQIGAGQWDVSLPLERQDEIGLLARAFDSMTTQLRGLVSGLEERVAERTHDLQRRAAQMLAASEIARDAAAIRDVNRLLREAVFLISERFGFYHAGVFLIDKSGEYAVLRAASSEGGQRMLQRGHKLAVGKTGIVGYVTGTGHPRIALDVGEDAVHFANPDLPGTRSEMALPLRAGDRVIGALDVQSTEPNAFSQEDIMVLQTMADQLAIAIENTRLIAQQARLAAQRRQVIDVYRDLSQHVAYNDLLKRGAETIRRAFALGRVTIGLREGDEIVVRSVAAEEGVQTPTLGESLPVGEGLLGQVAAQGQPAFVPPTGPDEVPRLDPLLGELRATLCVPLPSRGRIVGAVALEAPLHGSFDEDDIETLEVLASQLGTILENARLFEEAQVTLRQLDAVQRQQTAKTWSELLVGRFGGKAEAVLELETGEPGEQETALEAPISLRGETIGSLNLRLARPEGMTEEDRAILKAVADEVANQLEQVRLLDEIRRRATQLEAAAEVARDATGLLDLQTLLLRAVNLIRERFGFYHVSVFLLDEAGKKAVVREATGEAGREMKARRHSLAVGSQSVIGRVTASGECYVAHDVSQDPHYRPNPLLPETKCEAGIPLKIGDDVIGALDVQSTQPHSLSEDDVAVLEILADQLAVAVQNARLFAEALARAEREQEVVEITSKIRASGDIDSMLKVAVTELRRALGARRARIRLATEEEGSPGAESGSNGRESPATSASHADNPPAGKERR